MQIQDVKRRHWIAMGLVIGLALSYACSSVEWKDNLPGMSQADFEQGLLRPFPQVGHLANLVVFPPVDGNYKIVCQQLRKTDDPKMLDRRTVVYVATSPYQPFKSSKTFPTVWEYLKIIQVENPRLQWRYAWYRETWAVFIFWTGASLFLIGGVWPTMVSLLTGGGLGLADESRGPAYDLSRFGGKSAKAGASAGPTQGDLEALNDLDADMERQLSADAASADAAPDAGQTQAVTPLSSESSEQVPTQQEELEREYGGEYYPVVRSVHAKKQDTE